MHELKVTVTKIIGVCSSDPPMQVGDYFTVWDGNIRIPEGGHVCLWALQSLMPLLPAKEREIAESKDEDWMWRVHHAQCSDPDGRVIFKIERIGNPGRQACGEPSGQASGRGLSQTPSGALIVSPKSETPAGTVEPSALEGERKGGILRDLKVVVDEVRGKCTSGLRPGDHVILRGGRLYIPPNRHFCLYALQAVLPLLPAKQRPLPDGDWLKEAAHVICPDPAGNVVMRIERL